MHGALLDAEILADVYLVMTGGQTSAVRTGRTTDTVADGTRTLRLVSIAGRSAGLRVVVSRTSDELDAHAASSTPSIRHARRRQCVAIEALVPADRRVPCRRDRSCADVRLRSCSLSDPVHRCGRMTPMNSSR